LNNHFIPNCDTYAFDTSQKLIEICNFSFSYSNFYKRMKHFENQSLWDFYNSTLISSIAYNYSNQHLFNLFNLEELLMILTNYIEYFFSTFALEFKGSL